MAGFSSLDLCGPDPNPMTMEEVRVLKMLTRGLCNHPTIVNIGAERGTSTLAMLEECPNATIYSVDIGECEAEFIHLRKAGLDETHVIRVLGESQKIDPTPYAPIDMIFIDGDHRYEPVKQDIAVWTPFVRKGGIVAFHDYIPEPIPPHIRGRVVHAVDEWINANRDKFLFIVREQRLIAYQVM